MWIVNEPRLPLSGRGVGPDWAVDVVLDDPVDAERDRTLGACSEGAVRRFGVLDLNRFNRSIRGDC